MEHAKLEIIYLPGDPARSVPVDRRNWFSPLVFAGLLLVFGYSIVSVLRKAPKGR